MGDAYDIHERIFRFVINGLKIIGQIPNTVESKVIIGQYARCLTSVGANDVEADGTSTANDFIHIYTIVRKELKETHYWLRVLLALCPQIQSLLQPLIQESGELTKIVSKIIANSRKHHTD